ncbi:MAG: DMT family transporter [Bacteroidota bacterium]|nr:DMT family transporter [Bacteroidota bacterium]
MPGNNINNKNALKPIVAGILAFLFLASVSVLMKIEINNGATIEWAIFTQVATGFVIMLVIASKNHFRDLKTSNLKYHLVRGIGGVAAFAFTVIAISKIPLVDASLLNNTAPLFIPMITLIWLRTKIDKKIWWGILIGFVGIIFILDPKEDDLLNSGDLYGIAAGISLAIAYVALGVLTKTESFISILFYYAIIASALSLPFAILNWSNPPLLIWIYAVTAGTLFIAYSFLLQFAY